MLPPRCAPLLPALLLGLALASPLQGAGEGETGLQAEVKVKGATRLDWEFAAGAEAGKVPTSYDPRRVRYQLFVPPGYKNTRTWPVVLFLSPGDDPLGWKSWQKTCEEHHVFFCAPYAAGNNIPAGRRVRRALDVLDDVRHGYRLDPERTYVAGLGDGARLACSLAFALPEHFGGVVALGGFGDLPELPYLRQRGRARLSVALVAGERDFARRKVEAFAEVLRQTHVRSQLFLVPRQGHGLPPSDLTSRVYAWLEEDRKRRRQDAEARPGLSASADEVTPRRLLATRALSLAEADLSKPEKTFEGVSLLEWVAQRCDRTEGAEKARALLEEVKADPRKKALLTEQAGEEERPLLQARAGALEKLGQPTRAAQAWQALADKYPDSPEGKKGAAEARRLTEALARAPYLGASFEPDNLQVRTVVAGSPAAKAGLKAGDLLLEAAGEKLSSLAELRQLLLLRRPGDKLLLGVRRGGKPLTLTAVLSSPPDRDD